MYGLQHGALAHTEQQVTVKPVYTEPLWDLIFC